MVGSLKQLLPTLETRADMSRLQKFMGVCLALIGPEVSILGLLLH